MHLLTFVDEVLARCEVGQAFEKAPHAPAAGISTVAAFNEKLQIDLLLLGDIVALRVMGASPENSHVIPVRAETPQEVRDASRSSWIGVFGPPFSIQMDEGGEWRNELRAQLRSER